VYLFTMYVSVFAFIAWARRTDKRTQGLPESTP